MRRREGMPEPDPELAAELALGLLEGEERLDAERWRQADRAFADEVAAWEAHFARIADEVEPVAPRGRIKARVDRTLFGAAPSRRRSSPADRGNAKGRAGRRRRRRVGWFDGLWTGALVGVLAAGIAAMAIFPRVPGTGDTPPSAIAELVSDTSGFRAFALLTDDGARVLWGLSEGNAPPGRVLQFWAVRGDVGPVSLGLLDEAREGVFELPEALRAGDDTLILEISEEPLGGSPEPGPTGDVLGVGEVVEF